MRILLALPSALSIACLASVAFARPFPVPPPGGGANSPPTSATPMPPPPTFDPNAKPGDRPSVYVEPEGPPPAPAVWRTSIGAHVAEYNNLSPTDIYGFLVFLDGSHESSSAWSPSYRISVAHTFARTIGYDAGSASYAWTTGALDVCPMRVPIVTTVALVPCMQLGGGIVRASGVSGASPKSATRPWGTVGALARLQWRLGYLNLEAQAGVALAVLREDFGFGGTTAFEPDLWIPFGSLGAGVVF